MPGRRAVFVDRDDTLNKDCPYCRKPEDIELLPTVAEGVRQLNDAGLLVLVVTNQSGVGRGFFSEDELAAMHHKLQRDLIDQAGAHVDRFYYCTHLPDSGCPDRKPNIGLLLRGERDLRVDLARSAVIGDRGLDMEMARKGGCLAVMVPRDRGQRELPLLAFPPDYLAKDFVSAARFVVERLKV
jgi:histidinol-phosphate phosphatase family protein